MSLRLREQFRAECSTRMVVADLAVKESRSASRPALCFEQLHQELDSLHGAARAVDDAGLEAFFHVMSRYARHVARHAVWREVSARQRGIAERAITLVKQCVGDSGDGGSRCTTDAIAALTQDAEAEMAVAPMPDPCPHGTGPGVENGTGPDGEY